MRTVLHPLMILAAATVLAACQPAEQKAPEKPATSQTAPAADSHAADPHAGAPAMPPHGGSPHPVTPEEERAAAHGQMDVTSSAKKGTTVVPPEVKGKWKAATFIVVDRERSGAEEITIPLGGSHDLGGNLQVSAMEFLPDLRIDNNIYTSMSNDPNNPAARVVITDGGKEVFDGWLFAEFPQVHRFEHPRFGITLKEGVPN